MISWHQEFLLADLTRTHLPLSQVPIIIVFLPMAIALIWLFGIRPYCRRNGKGYTPGTNIAVTTWVDWQEATEIARSKNDRRMLLICRTFLLLHILLIAGGILAFLKSIVFHNH